MEKQHFVATVTYGTALYPGKSVLVTEISGDYPVPDFVLTACEPCAGAEQRVSCQRKRVCGGSATTGASTT